MAVLLFQDVALEHGLGQFLDEERDSIGLLQNAGKHLIGQHVAAGDPLRHSLAVVPTEAVE